MVKTLPAGYNSPKTTVGRIGDPMSTLAAAIARLRDQQRGGGGGNNGGGGGGGGPSTPVSTLAGIPQTPLFKDLLKKGIIKEGMPKERVLAILAISQTASQNPIDLAALKKIITEDYANTTGDITGPATDWMRQLYGANTPDASDPNAALYTQDPIWGQYAGGLQQMQETANTNQATDLAWLDKQQQAMTDYYNGLIASVSSGALDAPVDGGGGGGGGGGRRGYGGGGGGGGGDGAFSDPTTTLTTKDQTGVAARTTTDEWAPGVMNNLLRLAREEGNPDLESLVNQNQRPTTFLSAADERFNEILAQIDKGASIDSSNQQFVEDAPLNYFNSSLPDYEAITGRQLGDNPATPETELWYNQDTSQGLPPVLDPESRALRDNFAPIWSQFYSPTGDWGGASIDPQNVTGAAPVADFFNRLMSSINKGLPTGGNSGGPVDDTSAVNDDVNNDQIVDTPPSQTYMAPLGGTPSMLNGTLGGTISGPQLPATSLTGPGVGNLGRGGPVVLPPGSTYGPGSTVTAGHQMTPPTPTSQPSYIVNWLALNGPQMGNQWIEENVRNLDPQVQARVTQFMLDNPAYDLTSLPMGTQAVLRNGYQQVNPPGSSPVIGGQPTTDPKQFMAQAAQSDIQHNDVRPGIQDILNSDTLPMAAKIDYINQNADQFTPDEAWVARQVISTGPDSNMAINSIDAQTYQDLQANAGQSNLTEMPISTDPYVSGGQHAAGGPWDWMSRSNNWGNAIGKYNQTHGIPLGANVQPDPNALPPGTDPNFHPYGDSDVPTVDQPGTTFQYPSVPGDFSKAGGPGGYGKPSPENGAAQATGQAAALQQLAQSGLLGRMMGETGDLRSQSLLQQALSMNPEDVTNTYDNADVIDAYLNAVGTPEGLSDPLMESYKNFSSNMLNNYVSNLPNERDPELPFGKYWNTSKEAMTPEEQNQWRITADQILGAMNYSRENNPQFNPSVTHNQMVQSSNQTDTATSTAKAKYNLPVAQELTDYVDPNTDLLGADPENAYYTADNSAAAEDTLGGGEYGLHLPTRGILSNMGLDRPMVLHAPVKEETPQKTEPKARTRSYDEPRNPSERHIKKIAQKRIGYTPTGSKVKTTRKYNKRRR